jgi:hexosaminidase
VIPKAQRARLVKGRFPITATTQILHSKGAREKALQLADYLNPATGFSLRVKAAAEAETNSLFLALDEGLKSLGKEGYTLEVKPDCIEIKSCAAPGLFYGIQSLRQLLPAAIFSRRQRPSQSWLVPAVSIEDKPRYQWRGMMLDVARYFLDKDFVLRYLDMMAMHKLNVFHWHLIDDPGWRIEINKYPKLTRIGAFRGHGSERYGGYYTQEDIREVVQYAKDRHIEVVPEIAAPAHVLSAIAAYPELSCRAKKVELPTTHFTSKELYCAGKESTYTFIDDVLTEVLALFPGTYVHIGGDEAKYDRWEECQHCQQRMTAFKLKSAKELQGYMTLRIEERLQRHGKQMIGWDEILSCGVSKSAGIMTWHNEESAAAGARQGHPVVMALVAHAYFDTPESKAVDELPGATWIAPISLRKAYEWDPTPPGLSASEQVNIIGAQGCVWTDQFLLRPFLRDLPGLAERRSERYVEQLSLPRMGALAEVAWTAPEQRRFSDFEGRMAKHYSRYSQANFHFRIPAPKVQVKQQDGSFIITAQSLMEGGLVRFTKDGQRPDIYSELFTEPVRVEQKEDFRALVVAPEGKHHSVVFEYEIGSAEDSAHGDKIGCWEPGKTASERARAAVFEATGKINENGQYAVAFVFTKGAVRLNIDWVEVVKNSRVIARIEERGYAGASAREKTYELRIDEYETGASFEVRAGIYSGPGGDSSGSVFIKKTAQR